MDVWKSVLGGLACSALFHFMLAQLLLPSIVSDELITTLEITPLTLTSLSSVMLYSISLSLLPAGFLLDRLPIRNLLMMAALLAVLGTVALASYPSITTLGLNRLLCGVANGLSFLGGLLLMPQLFPRRPALACGMFLGLGQAGGWLVYGPLLQIKLAFDWQFMLWVLAVFCAVAGLSLSWIPSTPLKGTTSWRQAWRVLMDELYDGIRQRNPWICGIIVGLFGWPDMWLTGLFGMVYLTDVFMLTESQAGLVLSFLVLGWVLGFPLFGWVADHTTQWRRVLCLVSLGMIALLLVVPMLSAASAWMLSGLFFAMGLLIGATTIPFFSVQHTSPLSTVAMSVALTTILMNTISGLGQMIFGGTLPEMNAEYLTHAWWWLPVAFVVTSVLALQVRERR